MLLDKPLDSHPIEPNVELPPPSALKRKIIIKNKKKHHHHHHHHKKSGGGGAAAATASAASPTSAATPKTNPTAGKKGFDKTLQMSIARFCFQGLELLCFFLHT